MVWNWKSTFSFHPLVRISLTKEPLPATDPSHLPNSGDKQTGLQVFSSARGQLNARSQGQVGPSQGTSGTLGTLAILGAFATKLSAGSRALGWILSRLESQ